VAEVVGLVAGPGDDLVRCAVVQDCGLRLVEAHHRMQGWEGVGAAFMMCQRFAATRVATSRKGSARQDHAQSLRCRPPNPTLTPAMKRRRERRAAATTAKVVSTVPRVRIAAATRRSPARSAARECTFAATRSVHNCFRRPERLQTKTKILRKR
jgi:hypothetical protein